MSHQADFALLKFIVIVVICCLQYISPCDLKLPISLVLELKQTSEISGYLYEIHDPDTGFELSRTVTNYFKQL